MILISIHPNECFGSISNVAKAGSIATALNQHYGFNLKQMSFVKVTEVKTESSFTPFLNNFAPPLPFFVDRMGVGCAIHRREGVPGPDGTGKRIFIAKRN